MEGLWHYECECCEAVEGDVVGIVFQLRSLGWDKEMIIRTMRVFEENGNDALRIEPLEVGRNGKEDGCKGDLGTQG